MNLDFPDSGKSRHIWEENEVGGDIKAESEFLKMKWQYFETSFWKRNVNDFAVFWIKFLKTKWQYFESSFWKRNVNDLSIFFFQSTVYLKKLMKWLKYYAWHRKLNFCAFFEKNQKLDLKFASILWGYFRILITCRVIDWFLVQKNTETTFLIKKVENPTFHFFLIWRRNLMFFSISLIISQWFWQKNPRFFFFFWID